MAKFMCTICKYSMEGNTPPEKCPYCGNSCSFVDATCYTPECGFEENMNPDLYKSQK